jgi:hypothetical protein
VKSEKRSASREAQGGSAQQENMRGGKTKTQNFPAWCSSEYQKQRDPAWALPKAGKTFFRH